MDKLWSDDAWNDYLYWQIQDRDRHLFGPFLLIVYILLRYRMVSGDIWARLCCFGCIKLKKVI